MKLRVKDNFLQFRITRWELAPLIASERLEETVHFATTGDFRMTYALELSAISQEPRLRCRAEEIQIVLPLQEVERWARDCDLGMYRTIDLGEGGTLELLFEKDFDILEHDDEKH